MLAELLQRAASRDKCPGVIRTLLEIAVEQSAGLFGLAGFQLQPAEAVPYDLHLGIQLTRSQIIRLRLAPITMDAVELTPLQVERCILGPLSELAIDGLNLF